MGNKRKVLFVNDEMTMGGVARVLNTLMNNLDPTKYEIDCLILHKRGELLDEIPSHVKVLEGTSFFDTIDYSLKELIQTKQIKKCLKKIRLLIYMKTGWIKKKIQQERKKILSQHYDVEFAAKEGFCTIFTAYGDSDKKLNWVLTDYRVHNYSKRHMKLMGQALKKIDLNVADSKEALEAYQDVFKVSNGVAIHNLMDTQKVYLGMKEPLDESIDNNQLNVIVVARFHPQKRVDRVLYAHQEALKQGIDHHLYLVGGGQEENMLKEIVSENQLNQVHFLGFKKNPYALLSQCNLFVLSSEYEGFATIVNESLIATTPVLATRVSGITDQITKDEMGWIVENNQSSLTEKYIEVLCQPNHLKEMKEKLKNYHYPNDRIIKEFEAIL